jgi:hypothetical protein
VVLSLAQQKTGNRNYRKLTTGYSCGNLMNSDLVEECQLFYEFACLAGQLQLLQSLEEHEPQELPPAIAEDEPSEPIAKEANAETSFRAF